MIEIEIDKGQNIIDIIFDDFASCLVIKKALAANWPDCQGSIGEYYSISNYAVDERIFYTQSINTALSEGSDIEQMEAVREFLNLFANGKYAINKFWAKAGEIYFLSDNHVIYDKNTPQNETYSSWFSPNWESNYEPVIYSITNNKIDPDRVEYYCQQIKKGVRPTILTFEISNTLSQKYSRAYVLDGHHKIEAYLRLKESIPVISILKSEDCTNKTAPLLHFTKPILRDAEFRHLLENNDENLLSIDFINDKELTHDIDDILKNADRIEVSIINTLKKYADAKNYLEAEWLESRLNMLKCNPNVHLPGYGKGLIVYENRNDEKRGICWFGKTINTNEQLNSWIEATIK